MIIKFCFYIWFDSHFRRKNDRHKKKINMNILVGYSGFVGSNIKEQAHFDHYFNSSNITKSFRLNPDVLVYSGVRAEKFLANSEPEKDFAIIENAIENIQKINPKKIILISTVDVYPTPINVNESEVIDKEKVQPYGKNRLYLEEWVENNFEEYLIVRLPGLFGKNIKKNFIYDLIHIVPSMLNEKKFLEIAAENNWIKDYYERQENTFYKLRSISETEKKDLKQKFLTINFSALNFTDSRGLFQFYNLDHIWSDISIALQHNIKKLNLATEPISVNEIYFSIYQKEFVNEISPVIPKYDFHTLYGSFFNENQNYIRSKQIILEDIKKFILAS